MPDFARRSQTSIQQSDGPQIDCKRLIVPVEVLYMVEQLLKCDLMRLGLLTGLHVLSARLFVFYGLKFCGLGGQLRVLYPK